MLNVLTLMGRLTAEPEFRTTETGLETCRFTLAVERDYQKKGEEKVTDFIPCTAFRNEAVFISKYVHKGDLLACNGCLETRKYQDKKTGETRTAYNALCNRVYFAQSKVSGGGNGVTPPAAEKPAESRTDTENNYDDDELPF